MPIARPVRADDHGGFDSEAIFHTVMRVSDPDTKAAMQGVIDADFRPKTDHSVYADIIMELDAGTDLGRYRHQLSPRRFRELQAYQQDLESPEFRGLRRNMGALTSFFEHAEQDKPIRPQLRTKYATEFMRTMEGLPPNREKDLEDVRALAKQSVERVLVGEFMQLQRKGATNAS